MQLQLSFQQLPMGLLRSKSLDSLRLAACLDGGSSSLDSGSSSSSRSAMRGAGGSLRSRGSSRRRRGGGVSASDLEVGCRR
jgi:hypothetical protein